jgi:23S rRNA (cytosine1962-C5)-methyltransferase
MQGQPIDQLELLASEWKDYELLDSGGGFKLERYGPYTFVRLEPQAIWKPALPVERWQGAHATFQPTRSESGGHWQFNLPIEPYWHMQYNGLRFKVQTTGGRHLGVFPEQAVHWDWISRLVYSADYPIRVLNLFGYTGLATLAAARAGARLTHIDASKKAVRWGQDNQTLSGLDECSIRWIVDDAHKFVQREYRRGVKYDGLILDPPRFGRSPKGQVWEFFDSLPPLLAACREVFSQHPLFIVLTAYAIPTSALSLANILREYFGNIGGSFAAGELVLPEKSAGRSLPLALFARWAAEGQSPL